MVDFSLEVFPPKNKQSMDKLWQATDQLATLHPSFMTVTCGAGGSDKSPTRDLVIQMAQRYGVPVKAHLTCVGASRADIDQIANDYWNAGIRHIVALRGDLPGGEMGTKYAPREDGYAYAVDLVEGLKKQHDFDISVAAYPEGHPEMPSLDYDLTYLKKKIDAGADRAITQFFFDPEVYLRFRDRAVKRGITAPIIPGILPILSFNKLKGFAARCQASVPNFLHEMFDGVEADSLDHQLLAMNVLSHQITRLYEEGVEFFHFYTLNDTLLTKHVCTWLRAGF